MIKNHRKTKNTLRYFILLLTTIILGQMAKADKVLEQIIAPPSSAPINEYLINLSQKANVNLIADATDISPQQKVKQFPASTPLMALNRKPMFTYLMDDAQLQAKLTLLRFDKSTFLLWHEPKVIPLAQKLSKTLNAKYSDASLKTPSQTKKWATAKQLYQLLTHDMDVKQAQAKGGVLSISSAALPAKIRAQVNKIVKLAILRQNTRDLGWFRKELWKNGSIGFSTTKYGKETVPMVYIKAQKREDGYMLSFLGKPNKQPQQKTHSPKTKPPITRPNQSSPKTSISITKSRIALTDLLMQVSNKAGVQLTVSPKSALTQKLVTLRINKMSLDKFKRVIARVYDARWRNNGRNRLILQARRLDPYQIALSHIGQEMSFLHKIKAVIPNATPIAGPHKMLKVYGLLYQKIAQEITQNGFTKNKIIPISALSATTIDEIKQSKSVSRAISLLSTHNKIIRTSKDAYFQIDIKKPDTGYKKPYKSYFAPGAFPKEKPSVVDKLIHIQLLYNTNIGVDLGWWFSGKDLLDQDYYNRHGHY